MSDMSVGRATGNQPVGSVDEAGATAESASAQPILPEPFTPGATDDLMTALACLMMKSRNEDRKNADKQRAAAGKAADEAFDRKIDAMEELAKDTLTQGIVEGVVEGMSAAAEGVSAGLTYSADIKGADATLEKATAEPLDSGSITKQAMNDHAALTTKEAAKERFRSGLVSASAKGLSASGKFGGAVAKSAQEEDRKDQAIAERDVDKAKANAESAATEAKRAQDDIKETMQLIRGYIASKTAMQGAGVLYRG